MEPDEALNITKDAIANGHADCFKEPERAMQQADARYSLLQEAKRQARGKRKSAEQTYSDMIDELYAEVEAEA